MTDDRTALVVATDSDRGERLAAWLDGWTVRTAAGGDAAVRSLDGSVDVAVVDAPVAGLSRRLLPALREADCRLVLLTDGDGGPAADDADRHLVRPVEPADLADAAEEVRLRARYHELVGQYYDAAVERTALERGPGDDERAREVRRRLEDLRSELDEIFSELAELDALTRLCRELPSGEDADDGSRR